MTRSLAEHSVLTAKRSTAHRALVVALAISLALEAALTTGGFVARDLMIAQFKLQLTDDTRFLGLVMAWMLLFVTLVCAVTLSEVRRGTSIGRKLSYVLGFWWIGIGLSLAFGYGRWDHLVLDSAKGAIIVVLTFLAADRSTLQT